MFWGKQNYKKAIQSILVIKYLNDIRSEKSIL